MQALLDRLHDAFDCPTAVIDTEGNVLTATAWADACTQFHRRHPLAAQECKQSDLHINNRLHEGERSVTYRCPRGLVECGSPIVIDGRHLGNVFIGQILLEEPDLEGFAAQAKAFGFDEKAYLAAVSRLTVMTKGELERRVPFLRALAETIAGMGLVRLRTLQQGRQLVEAQRIASFGSFDFDTSTQRMSLSRRGGRSAGAAGA